MRKVTTFTGNNKTEWRDPTNQSVLINYRNIMQKVKFTLAQAMKAQRGNGGIALSLTSALDKGGWLTPSPGRFTPGKETRYPLYRRLGGLQGRSGRVRKFWSPLGIPSPDRPSHSDSLYQLSYPGPPTVGI